MNNDSDDDLVMPPMPPPEAVRAYVRRLHLAAEMVADKMHRHSDHFTYEGGTNAVEALCDVLEEARNNLPMAPVLREGDDDE